MSGKFAASWFETRGFAPLTMRVTTAFLLILRSAPRARLEESRPQELSE